MCRFALYVGPPVRLASLVTEPSHSLIHQSFHAEEREEPLNGDGFGMGWYAPRLMPEPACYHTITPAWNDANLASLAKIVTSPCIFAHVRAATVGSAVNLANTHPFVFKHHMLMHNGHVGATRQIRRPLTQSLSDEAFHVIRGSTDTELVFAAFVDELLRHGNGSRPTPANHDGALDLAVWLTEAIGRVLEFVRNVGDGATSTLNVAVTDGTSAAITRFADDVQEGPETLYVLNGELYEPTGRRFEARRMSDDEGEAVLVSSERLTEDPRWEAVPPNHIVIVDRWRPTRLLPLGPDGRIVWSASPRTMSSKEVSEAPLNRSTAPNP